MKYESIGEWCDDKGFLVIRRWIPHPHGKKGDYAPISYLDRHDLADPETAEVIGSFYPDGFLKASAFINVRNVIDKSRTKLAIKYAVRNFCVLNGLGDDDVMVIRDYIRMVAKFSNYNLGEHDIATGINLGIQEANGLDLDDIAVKSYYTFNRKVDSDTVNRVIRFYNGQIRKYNSINLIRDAIDALKIEEVFITQSEIALRTVAVDPTRVGVSRVTVNKHFDYFKDDVVQHNFSYFGIKDWKEYNKTVMLEEIGELFMQGYSPTEIQKIINERRIDKEKKLSRTTVYKYIKEVSQ